jgi:hypothetical protein
VPGDGPDTALTLRLNRKFQNNATPPVHGGDATPIDLLDASEVCPGFPKLGRTSYHQLQVR